MFADLKKHTFTYQFYSSAQGVTDCAVKWEKFADVQAVWADERKDKLSNHLKQLAKDSNVFPQLTILDGKFNRCSVPEFIDREGDYLFVVIDSTNLPAQTGYHTLTTLAFIAWLRQ
jgi:hypothetical protein